MGRRRRGRAPRREALFHFPVLLRFLRSVSLTSLNFTALGLWPPSPPRGGSGCRVGEPPGPRGDSTRRGAGQAQGAGLCGVASLRPTPPTPPPTLFPGAFPEEVGGPDGPGPGVEFACSFGPGPAPFQAPSPPHLPPLAPSKCPMSGCVGAQGGYWKREPEEQKWIPTLGPQRPCQMSLQFPWCP